MAVTLTASTPFQSTASVTTATVTLPTGLADGDYTLLCCALNASSGFINPPAGWDEVLTSTNSDAASGSTSLAHAIYVRKWQSGDSDPVVTCKSGRFAVLPVRVEGADSTTFLETVAAVTKTTTKTTDIIAPSVDSVDSPLLCYTLTARHASGGHFITFLPAAGDTELGEAGSADSTTTNASVSLNTSVITPGAASGTRTGTASETTTGAMAASFIIKAAPTAPPEVAFSGWGIPI